MRQLTTLFRHRYLPPDKSEYHKCKHCDHWYGNEKRCGLIEASEGPVEAGDCCRFWENTRIVKAEYGAKLLRRKPTTRPPDMGRLMTKAEALFAEDVDASIQGCGDCQFFKSPTTCTLIGEQTVEADGSCTTFWRNIKKEAADPRLHAEFKTPPPEVRESGWLRKWLKSWGIKSSV